MSKRRNVFVTQPLYLLKNEINKNIFCTKKQWWNNIHPKSTTVKRFVIVETFVLLICYLLITFANPIHKGLDTGE